ncbi:hypothetical protein D3C85_942210 [compost metagenome]
MVCWGNIDKYSYADMGKHLKRTAESVRGRAREFGLGKQARSKDKKAYKEREAFIRSNYKLMTHRQMAELLGIDVEDVSRMCTRRR